MKTTSRITLIFSFAGVLFGLIFPVIGTVIMLNEQSLSMNLENILELHRASSLLKIIDTAPLILGITAAFLGFFQGRSTELAQNLREQYQSEAHLRKLLDEEKITLQDRVKERTEALERRNRFIEAAAEIGKTATSIMNLQELINRVVELISETFDFYQAGIFFLDERGEYAVMQAASSEGGKRMLARGHKLKVGEQGIVGYVTDTGLPRIALDVGEDAVHFNTPELPQTRSEMALPLFVGGRIFGALDVQSTESNAFTEEDISALTVLSDQVAMAINNARLFQDLQARIESEQQAYGEFSREAWRNLVRHTGRMEYKFSNNKLTTPAETWPEEMTQALKLQEPVLSEKQDRSLSVPLTISGQAVGAIRVQKSTALDWNNDEIDLIQTLTERLSQALESARLYRSSQQQAMQEQLTSSISARLRQTLDIDTVLKTAAKELGDAFNAKEVVIRMAANEPGN